MSRAELHLAPQDKLATHRQFVDHLQGRKVYPINVEISPSGVCNASCDFCFYAGGELGSHRNVFLENQRLMQLIDECRQLLVKSISWTGGGEPTLHPRFPQAVEFAAGIGLEQGLFTNALAEPKYDPRLLEWIRVTITDKPPRRDYIRALRPVANLSIAFNYAGTQDDDSLRHILAMAEDVNVDYVQLRPALKFHGETVDILLPNVFHPLLHVTAYKFAEARKKHGYKTCEAYHFSPMVWEDGNVDVCSYMRKHEGYTLGSLYKDSLRTILDRAPPSVPVHEQCQVCCRLHEMNKMVHHARSLADRNFP